MCRIICTRGACCISYLEEILRSFGRSRCRKLLCVLKECCMCGVRRAAEMRGKDVDRERSPSIDLAVGLRSSGNPEEVALDPDLEASLAHYLPLPAGTFFSAG